MERDRAGTALHIGTWIAAAYLVFYLGGDYSFSYTHECVRGHTEQIADEGGYAEVLVCDWYTANEKRWTFGDPVRAIYSIEIRNWKRSAIVGGILLLMVIAVWRNRRRATRRKALLREYRAVRERHDPPEPPPQAGP